MSPSFDRSIEAESIHTLGPAFTSSHVTAIAVQKYLAPEAEIVLHDCFEGIFERGHHDCRRLVLVPSAYAGANAFFMEASMSLVGCFCHDTPPYRLAWCAGKAEAHAILPRPLRVASHPAPIGLLPRLMPSKAEYTLVLCRSTVAAAISMLNGEADLALYNQRTIDEFGLNAISKSIVINMTWNLFRDSTL